ncbi:MAG: GxxExxY protein, partial [Bacteroidota bacterium]
MNKNTVLFVFYSKELNVFYASKVTMTREELNSLGTKIIGAAIEVHKELEAGLLESVYEVCLAEELRMRGIKVQEQVKLP